MSRFLQKVLGTWLDESCVLTVMSNCMCVWDVIVWRVNFDTSLLIRVKLCIYGVESINTDKYIQINKPLILCCIKNVHVENYFFALPSPPMFSVGVSGGEEKETKKICNGSAILFCVYIDSIYWLIWLVHLNIKNKCYGYKPSVARYIQYICECAYTLLRFIWECDCNPPLGQHRPGLFLSLYGFRVFCEIWGLHEDFFCFLLLCVVEVEWILVVVASHPHE